MENTRLPPDFFITPDPRQSKKTSFTPTTFLVIVIAMAVAFTGGWFSNAAYTSPPPTARPYAATIWTAWQDIDKYYVNQSAVDHQKMAYAMLTAMVNSLGDTGHSRFLTPADVAQFNQQISNTGFVGIGIMLQTISTTNGTRNIVEAALPNSPALKAGLLPGDQIIGVNGADVTAKTLDDLHSAITGKAGTSVSITIFRPSDQQQHIFQITRGTVSLPNVLHTYFSDLKIGYVQITGFNTGTTDETTKALNDLTSQGAKGIILDLRDNPGGLIDEAIGVASDFLPANTTVVYEKSSSGGLQADKTASTGLHLTLPVTVLVNGGTASAAEIVTGAIKDQRPTTSVIGEQTFGTDTVLLPFDLPDGSQVLLGVKEFLSPNKVQLKPGVGLQPTVVVHLPQSSFPINPLVIDQLHLTEQQIIAGQGLSNDTQLSTAIQTLQKQITQP